MSRVLNNLPQASFGICVIGAGVIVPDVPGAVAAVRMVINCLLDTEPAHHATPAPRMVTP